MRLSKSYPQTAVHDLTSRLIRRHFNLKCIMTFFMVVHIFGRYVLLRSLRCISTDIKHSGCKSTIFKQCFLCNSQTEYFVASRNPFVVMQWHFQCISSCIFAIFKFIILNSFKWDIESTWENMRKYDAYVLKTEITCTCVDVEIHSIIFVHIFSVINETK